MSADVDDICLPTVTCYDFHLCYRAIWATPACSTSPSEFACFPPWNAWSYPVSCQIVIVCPGITERIHQKGFFLIWFDLIWPLETCHDKHMMPGPLWFKRETVADGTHMAYTLPSIRSSHVQRGVLAWLWLRNYQMLLPGDNLEARIWSFFCCSQIYWWCHSLPSLLSN